MMVRRRSFRTALLALVPLLATACSDPPPLERSCDGESVGSCPPYAYALVTEGTLSPPGLEIGSPVVMAQVHARLTTCGDRAPAAHQVRIRALATRRGLPDGGPSEMLYSLATVTDDDRDGAIDVSIDNPFGAEVPAETDLELGFEAFSPPSCVGGTLERIPYRTGPVWTPPPPP